LRKTPLKVSNFETTEKIRLSATPVLTSYKTVNFKICFDKKIKHWIKYVDSKGAYLKVKNVLLKMKVE